MSRDWNLPLTYPPKIEPVKRGDCKQTIRFCTISKSKKYPGEIIRKQVGDRVRFYRWTGRRYGSHPEYITGYMELVTVINCIVCPDTLERLWPVGSAEAAMSGPHECRKPWKAYDCLAARDFIDPPTGEALRDVLIGKNSKISAEGAPAQILRWKP